MPTDQTGRRDLIISAPQLEAMRVASDLGEVKFGPTWHRLFMSEYHSDNRYGAIPPGTNGWSVVVRKPLKRFGENGELHSWPLLPHFRAGRGSTLHSMQSFSLRENGRRWVSLNMPNRRPLWDYPFLTEERAAASLVKWLLPPRRHAAWVIWDDSGESHSVVQEPRSLNVNLVTNLAAKRAVSYFLGMVSVSSCVLPFYLSLKPWYPSDDKSRNYWEVSGLHFSRIDENGEVNLGRQILVPGGESNAIARFMPLREAEESGGYHFLDAETAYESFKTTLASEGLLWIPGSAFLSSPVRKLPPFQIV